MKKLKLIPPPKPAEVAMKIVTPIGFESPLGWWRVETEGDCEGRTIRQLGEWYGHVAEIAFHLADKNSYSLQFCPILDRPRKLKQDIYQATRDKVWVSLTISSGTWGMSHEDRAKWFAKWLDCPDDINVFPKSPNATYYASSYLILK